MKGSLLVIGICLFSSGSLLGQSEFLERQAEKAKNKVVNRVENKIDEGMEAGLDKTEESIEEGVKNGKNDKKSKGSKSENSGSQNKDDQSDDGNSKSQNSASSSSGISKNNTGSSKTNDDLKRYSKFDFVPGEKVIGMEEFQESNLGDFPVEWNTNASAEIVTLGSSSNKWLAFLQDGYFQPEFVTEMPENFTLEFDVLTRYRSSNILSYGFEICAMNSPRKEIASQIHDINAGFEFTWEACIDKARYKVYEKGEITSSNEHLSVGLLNCTGDDYSDASIVHFSIWRQKNRLRVYVNENKVLDVPYGLLTEYKYNSFRFKAGYMNYSEGENKDEFMATNIRYAVGSPDTRSKLMTDGKIISRGILFDVNSDQIKPNSYGALKEIATALTENPTVTIQIVGHTDADGSDEANLALSKKRAEAVKIALNKEFGIDLSRMTTDGKGESQPTDPNTTSVGKANNRRVEFIKTN